jgi:hypothetical protein
MEKRLLEILRGIGYAVVLIVPTWLFFAPLAGFHHMIVCGILCPIGLDGEGPIGNHPLWGEYKVNFFWGRFCVSLVLWGACVFFGMKFVRLLKSFRHPAQ